jgi:molybdate transport system permease protein
VDWDPIYLSLRIALVATLVTLVLGVAIAAALAWPKMFARDVLDAVVTVPMVLPPTVLGYYLLVALGKESAIGRAWKAVFGSDIVFTFTGAVVAAAVGSLPFVVKFSRTAIEDVDPTLQQAARTLGAGPVRVFFTVTLPLAARGIAAGTMLAFARALGDFGVTLMMIGIRLDDTSTASIYIYDQLNQLDPRHEDIARNMSIAMGVVGITIMIAANLLIRRRRA